MFAFVAGMTATGSAISYPIWRFWLRTRLTVCLANHVGYLLVMMVFIMAVNTKLIRDALIFAAGPLSFWGRGANPILNLFMVGVFTVCLLLLMSAHTFRRNLIGVILTSLGAAMWYFAGFYGVLARGP